jgi:hypothetical protein
MKNVLTLRLAVIGAAVLALVAGIYTVALQLRPDVAPVSQSRRLFDFPGNCPYYWWLSPTEILIARNPSQPTFVRRSITSQSETPLPEVDAFFKQSAGDLKTVRASANGAGLIWTSTDKKSVAVFSLLDPVKRAVINEEDPSLAVWLSDSSGWLTLQIRSDTLGGVRFYSLNNLKTPTRKTVLTYPMPATDDATNLRTIIMTPQGQFMVQGWKSRDSAFDNAHLFVSGFGPAPVNYSHIQTPAPHKNEGGELFFAPVHRLVGWQLAFQSPMQALLDMGSRPLAKYQTGFWVTRGQETRSLGYLETIRDDPDSGPFNVQFSPNGDNISYIYKNAFYTLPVSFQTP